MEKGPCWETETHILGQEISYLSWNQKVHYHVCKTTHMDLSQSILIKSTTSHPASLGSILPLFSHLDLDHPNSFFPLDFLIKTNVCISNLYTYATFIIHLKILDLIILKSKNYIFAHFLHSPIISCLSKSKVGSTNKP